MSQLSFRTVGLADAILSNLESLNYQSMTPVQAQSLPPILAGRDVIAQAKTGSGKTAAFGLGVIQQLQTKDFRVQALILCPTRELADQVAKELRKLARSVANVKILTLCGGMALGPQIGSLEHGAHIVVGTPGRLEAHLRKGTLKLDALRTCVLDEADRMLDMGFEVDIDKIISHLPKQRQSLLFSATFPDEIESMAKRLMSNPFRVTVEEQHDSNTITQLFHLIDERCPRQQALKLLLLHYRPAAALVFCNTKQETLEVVGELRSFGFSALALNGDLEQKQRNQTLVMFANGSVNVLVATDVAARGLDISSLDLVVNYNLAHEPDIHVHRVGRTGRAGGTGRACTLYKANQQHKLEALAEHCDLDITPTDLPPVSLFDQEPEVPTMTTLKIDGGKKQKLRPGDILGALTGKGGIAGKHVGKIDIAEMRSYVAVSQSVSKAALRKLSSGKLKGKAFRVRKVYA